MGAPCSKMVDPDVVPSQRRMPKEAAAAPRKPNTQVDPCCPIHGACSHDGAAPADKPVLATTPASTRLLQGGPPVSPVSTRFFTPMATGGALSLRTPATRAGGIPAEEQEPVPLSSYARTKRGGIRKTGLHLVRPAQAYVVGEPATLKVEIRNAQAKPLEGTTLRVLDNGCFAETSFPLPEIGAGQTVTVEVTAKPKRPTLALKDLKGEVEMRVMRGSDLLMAQVFVLDALDFAGDLMPLVQPPAEAGTTAEDRFLNIYLLGAKGSGKTAFLQTLSSTLLQTPPPAPGDTNVPTVELDRVNFAKFLAAASKEEGGDQGAAFFRRPFNVRVFDLWGTDGGDSGAALDSELAGILAGLAPIGFTAAHRVAGLAAEDAADLAATKAQRAADAVLFFVAPGDVEDPLRMEALKGTFDAAKAALGGHSPLVVLGRADSVDPRLAAEPLNWSSKKVATLRKRLATAFGVSWAQTFVAVPYAAVPAPKQQVPTSLRSASMTAQPATLDGSQSQQQQQPQPLDASLSLSTSKANGNAGPARNFEVDRLVLLIAGAALEAARLKAEGKAPAAAPAPGTLPPTPRSVFTPASTTGAVVGSVRRLPTVDLSTMDGSFWSNFHLPPRSAKAGAEPLIVVEVEKSEAGAP